MESAENSEEYSNYGETNLIDDLFILKSKLNTKGKENCLTQIQNLTEDYPNLYENLFRWNFLSNEILLTLRVPSTFLQSLGIITETIKEVKKLPDLYLTRKFLFFITEKLYFAMKSGNDSEITAIQRFATVLIEIEPATLDILFTTRFLDLVSTIINHESCILFNTIFKDFFFFDSLSNTTQERWQQDIMYEVQRKNFDSEIVFREKSILHLKNQTVKYKKGILENIYNELLNLPFLLDLSIKDSLDLLCYKRMQFMNDDLDILLVESNEKAIKAYRRSLESGSVADGTYLAALVKGLHKSESRIDSAICLFYISEGIKEFGIFNQESINLIFECLEYSCTLECSKESNDLKEMTNSSQMTNTQAFVNRDSMNMFGESTRGSQISVDHDLMDILGEIDSVKPKHANLDDGDEIFLEPTLTSKLNAKVCDRSEILPLDVDSTNRCERSRILQLLSVIYDNVDKRLFYKPSFLVLLRSCVEHCKESSPFLNLYFSDFLCYLAENGLARPLVSGVPKKKKAVYKTYVMEQNDAISLDRTDFNNSGGAISSTNDIFNLKERANNSEVVSTNVEFKPRGPRNIIDSSEDEIKNTETQQTEYNHFDTLN